MAVLSKTLIQAKEAEAVLTAQYTAVGCRAVIDKFTATNHGVGDVQFSIYIVPNAGTATVVNQILRTRTIAPGECYLCPEIVGHILEDGSFISTIANTANAITICASGREIT